MQYWGITDPGCVRPQNQDNLKMEELDRNSVLCVVCDGMGGAKSGNVASSLAVDVFVQNIKDSWKSNMSPEEVDILLLSTVKLVNFTVFDQAMQVADFAGMGTTLVAALIHGKQMTVVNVGDSRCYHLRSSGIQQITVDHSLVQMMISRGELTAEQARCYSGKNLITRAIGTESSVQCDLFHVDLERGDGVLLCSDGLSNMMDEQEILFEYIHGSDREGCCRQLLDVAKNRGAPDNVTCILVQI